MTGQGTAQKSGKGTALVAAVDRVPEVRGCGVVYRSGDRMIRLRGQGNSGATVVFELRQRDAIPPFLRKDASSRSFRFPMRSPPTTPLQPGWSVGGASVAGSWPRPIPKHKAGPVDRGPSTSPA